MEECLRNEFLMDVFFKVSWLNVIVFCLNAQDMYQQFEDLKDYKRRRDALSKNNSRASGAFKFFNITRRVLKTEPKNRIVRK